MKSHRAILSSVLLLLALTLSVTPTFGAFSNVVQLVIREGDVPTTNGVAIVGAPAYAGTVDTYVDAANPDTSYGSAAIVKFGWPGTTESVKIRGYLRFDNLTNYIPANAKITRTLLYLTSAGSAGAGGGGGPDIFYRGSTWNEGLTWNTDTDYANSTQIGITWLAAWGVQPSNDVAWLDITAYAQAWHSGALVNHGLQWRPVGGWSDPMEATYTFHSRESSISTNRPKLVVEYVVDGPLGRIAMPVGTSAMKSRTEYLRGANVFDDTHYAKKYYGGDTDQGDVNFEGSTSVDLRSYNNANTPRRALLKVKMNHPELAKLAKTSDPLNVGQPRLMSACLQYCISTSWDQFRLWTLAQDWDVNQVTYNNRYTNPVNQAWAQGWPGTESPMSNVVQLVGTDAGDNQWHRGGTKRIDVTSVIQGYVNGSNNYGLLLGHEGAAPYENRLYFTEDSLEFRRPTLVMQVWDPVQSGTVILLK